MCNIFNEKICSIYISNYINTKKINRKKDVLFKIYKKKRKNNNLKAI